nr:nucleotidyltransferase domain-containing protein [uncultured Actinoplanes sp.]
MRPLAEDSQSGRAGSPSPAEGSQSGGAGARSLAAGSSPSAMDMILSVVVGSRAYGLDGPGSDHDRRGVFVVPTALFWHLDKPPTHLEGPLPEQFSWELERFCTLALQANPTVLEVLWSPLIEKINDTGQELLAVRSAFLSRRVFQTYGAYAADQLKRVTDRCARTGRTNHKQAMHMIRLLMAGAHVLRTGSVLVDVSPSRDRLLAIRHGSLPWPEITAWATALQEDLATAATETRLPPSPDRDKIDQLLVRVRERNVP